MCLKTNSRAARRSLVKFWDFQFREVPDSRKGFERRAEEISEELTVSTTKLKVFCLRIISFSSLESKSSSDWKDSEINFDRARLTTVKSLLGALRFVLFQATTEKTSLRTSCLYVRNGKLDTKWRSSKTKSRKENSRTTLGGKFITKTQGSHECLKPVYSCR